MIMWLAPIGAFGAMADFQSIAAVILEKDGIIAMSFVISRPSTFRAPARMTISANRSTSLVLSAQKAIRHSLAICRDDSVTPKNSVAPSVPAASNCSQPSILTLRVNPSAGSIAS
jgi:hypothetical protein